MLYVADTASFYEVGSMKQGIILLWYECMYACFKFWYWAFRND